MTNANKAMKLIDIAVLVENRRQYSFGFQILLYRSFSLAVSFVFVILFNCHNHLIFLKIWNLKPAKYV